MSVTFRIRNIASLGLLISLYLFSGVGRAEQIVDTDPHVVLELGTRGVLPCRIQRRMFAVEWKRQVASESESLVSLHPFSVSKRYGQGYEAGMFNITDDYSLVIKDVKVQDEGIYICLFSDYQTGITFRNSTRVSVQALPREPFPTIQECIGKEDENSNSSVCTVTINSTSNLTCLVDGYYPEIDLFFLHGSHNVASTAYEEWTNVDGTKSKSTTIPINVSDEPYQCVASGLTGMVGNRSLSVIVRASVRRQGLHAAAIAVLVIVSIVCIAGIIKCRVWSTRHGFYGRVPGEAPVRVSVSKLELWTLVTKAKEKHDFEKLREALCRLRHLSKTDASKLQRDDDFYESLCEWKSKTSSDPNQRKKLFSACSQVGMLDITRTLEDLIRDTSYQVSQDDIEHILWEIGDTSKISELLRALNLAHEEVTVAKGIREVINAARGKLMMWLNRKFDLNPLVILSSKLDDLQCETNFFKLHKSLKEEIDDGMMKAMCCRVFGDHYMYLTEAIRDHHGQDLPHEIKKFVEENNESLFNVLKMICDWIRDEECSNYEKRKKLLAAVEAARQTHHTDAKWPPDEDLRVIASFLSPTSMEQLCSKLGTKRSPQQSSQEERLQALAEWRDNYASSKALMEKHTELFSALKEVDRGCLVPPAKGPLVYKAELVDLAFHLFAQDLLPFTEALGISAAKLVDYRPTFQPTHMTKGTIGLVCILCESVQRSDFFNLLKEVPNVLASAMLALEVSFEEVCAISVRPEIEWNPLKASQSFSPRDNKHDRNMKTRKPSSSCPDIYEDTTSNEWSDSKVYKETANDLTPMLTSASKVEGPNQVSPESSAFIKHFQLWRKQPRMKPFNFRLAVAESLRIKVKPSLMSDFLRGDCNKGEIPFTFVYDMIQTMDADQARNLLKLIGLTSFSPVAVRLTAISSPKEEMPRPKEIAQSVLTWAKEWLLQVKPSEWEKGEDGIMTTEVAKKHKEFNDKLVDHGFIDLAREIMISKRQLIDALCASKL